MARKNTTRVDGLIAWFKNNLLIAILIVVGIGVVWLGAVAGGVGAIVDLWERIVGKSDQSASSITVDLPAGLTFRQAVQLLVEDANAAAKFDSSCRRQLLASRVNAGTMRGRTVADLLEQLRYRLSAGDEALHYKVNVLMEGSVYEISCK